MEDLTTDLSHYVCGRAVKLVFWLLVSQSASQPIKMIYGLTKPTDHLLPHVLLSSMIQCSLQSSNTWLFDSMHPIYQSLTLLFLFRRAHIHKKKNRMKIVKLVKKRIVTLDRSINQLAILLFASSSFLDVFPLCCLCLAAPVQHQRQCLLCDPSTQLNEFIDCDRPQFESHM